MIVHHFKSKFRAILSREKRKDSSNSSVNFFDPVPKEITLFDVQKINDRNIKEEAAGFYLLPLEKKYAKTCTILLQSDDNLKLVTQNLRDLICFPVVGEGRNDVRHLFQTKFHKTNQDWIVWEGEAIFSYFIEEEIVTKVIPSTKTKEVITSSSPVVIVSAGSNEDPWWQPEAGKQQIISGRAKFSNQVEKSFPWGLLILGLVLLFVNPILGSLILFWAFFSLTRGGKNNFSSSGQSQIPPLESGIQNSEAKATGNTLSGSNEVSTNQPLRNKPNIWGAIASVIFAIPVLFFLWTLLPSLFWLLLVSLMLFGFGFFSPSKSWFFVSKIIFYFLFILSLLFLLGILIQNLNLLPEADKDSETETRTEKVKDSTTNELLNRHLIVWENPHLVGKDELTYFTADKNYLSSKQDHKSVSNISNRGSTLEYWNKVYNRLLVNDQFRVDSLARLVSNVAKERQYSQFETAEYLISLIQELPYVLVHDYSCQEVINNAGDFVRDYHLEGKPCLPNIIAGVHSPYEFMHTLAGDCDTRSLFGHAVLNKLGISSSIWISEQYGHSILGVGVPVSSNVQKMVMGVPHYGVELTAKGFRLGMISPDQRNLKNWNIALFKNF